MNRYRVSLASTVFVLACLPTVAGATSIAAGPRIVISPTTIVVPVEIADGVNVAGWEFDLTYDATDLQVNTACHPFGGDPYCSLITGPVTEGNFFASGAPFNLLIPGFVDLDPSTLNQTGLLFGVAGTFGGSAPPYPSGNGTLAFVEFTVLGTGTSPVHVVNPSIDVVSTPEPATLLLLLGGVPFVRSRRSSRNRLLVVVAIVAAGLLFSPGAARAQTTAVGPYYATPSWDQTIACTMPSNCPRFVVLANFDNNAVLDRETGLVWERSPSETLTEADLDRCANLSIGNREGWRQPTQSELRSLIDSSQSNPSLPPGHPFTNLHFTLSDGYWTTTDDPLNPGHLLLVIFAIPKAGGSAPPSFVAGRQWCVRGPSGSGR
jgi:hypothetical protein